MPPGLPGFRFPPNRSSPKRSRGARSASGSAAQFVWLDYRAGQPVACDSRHMRRIVETSVGWVELDARKVKVGGLSVTITVFDDENWETGCHTWGEDWEEGKTLADAFAETVGLPRDESGSAR